MRIVLRLGVALCGACTVLVFGAWLGGAFAAGSGALPSTVIHDLGYERVGAGGEIGIGDALEVNGQPMQLSVFYTADPPLRVALFYARAFEARGVTPIVSPGQELAHVAGFDPADGHQRFITATAQPDGQTLVLVGITNPRKLPRFTRGAGEAGFPVPPQNRAYLGYRSTDGGAEAESGQFVSSLAPAEVLAYYRAQLAPRGFSERNEDSSATLRLFGKGSEVLSVAVQALGDRGGAAVFVNRTGGSR